MKRYQVVYMLATPRAKTPTFYARVNLSRFTACLRCGPARDNGGLSAGRERRLLSGQKEINQLPPLTDHRSCSHANDASLR